VERAQTGSSVSSAQLDARWFKLYQSMVSFDLFTWLAPAGPFTVEEQREWEQLFGREDDAARERMGTIMARSRDRELAVALEEQREPRLCYPAIAIERVCQSRRSLQQLYREIATVEQNRVVRGLYLDAIDEQLDLLHMVEATYYGDADAFAHYNYRVCPVPSPQEMDYAFGRLLKQLRRGLKRQETVALSMHLLEYLRHRRLFSSLETLDEGEEDEQEAPRAAQQEMPSSPVQVTFPATTVKLLFEAVLHDYDLDHWRVLIDPAALAARVEPQIRAILLPETPLPFDKVVYLLSHELESHLLRFVAGERSALALLGVGTKGYLATEEGLALHADLMTARARNPQAPERIPWLGTLATGLAGGASLSSGAVIAAHSFRALFLFLEQYHLLLELLKQGATQASEAMRERARSLALTRCLRTFRGVPDLTQQGICSMKDTSYVRGYLTIKEALSEQGEEVLTRLMVGAVALEQLPDLATLGIITPAVRPRWFARDPDLLERITSLVQVGDAQVRKNK
jgi:hypothetical protein